MPISQPRRIFRSGWTVLPSRGVALVLLAAALVAGGTFLTKRLLEMPGPAAAQAPTSTERLDASPSQVAVVDGATLRLRDHVVRLLGVDPPSRGAACQMGASGGFDCGTAAANALAGLVQNVSVDCRLQGHDDLGRPFAICEASGTELNRAVVAAGWARADGALPALKTDEDAARAQRRGVWSAGTDANW